MKVPKKERDLAGTAAFEVALQYIMVRQDRSYHFVQLLTAICSLIFTLEACFIFVFSFLLPVLAVKPERCFPYLQEYASLPVAFFSGVCLILLRAGNQRYAIEPGEQLMRRLNNTVIEPCLGMHFDCATGKLRSDELWAANVDPLVPADDASQA
ncbi:hypothetical protein DQ04_00061390 [Trypanosoma grayi]|uniref:hypothetical protein n=1 Tax=Trypanosoma grayi TaxID=71804 RepID=UPI0004F4892B|nr:hypothetical protein DQ04_00061390 [Trypanosoma grayi]KEG15501.1 hypothetical protein DQ04_00061390 [Trypanosoma grayi]